MKTKQLSNTARVIILLVAMSILTVVSAKADMIKATYSPYKCTMDSKVNDPKITFKVANVVGTMNELSIRKFNFKNHPEANKLTEEVRRYDVTSSKPKLLLVVEIPDCEIPVYKII